MILDRMLEFYSRTVKDATPGDEGIKKYTYNMFLSTRGNLQPARLSESTLAQWGLTTIQSDAKIVFVPGELIDGQAWLIKDLKTSLRYEVRGSNPWNHHSEFLVVPYQGKDPI
jgi:hypothetical protein